jgi:hypothetical protein
VKRALFSYGDGLLVLKKIMLFKAEFYVPDAVWRGSNGETV